MSVRRISARAMSVRRVSARGTLVRRASARRMSAARASQLVRSQAAASPAVHRQRMPRPRGSPAADLPPHRLAPPQPEPALARATRLRGCSAIAPSPTRLGNRGSLPRAFTADSSARLGLGGGAGLSPAGSDRCSGPTPMTISPIMCSGHTPMTTSGPMHMTTSTTASTVLTPMVALRADTTPAGARTPARAPAAMPRARTVTSDAPRRFAAMMPRN